MTKKSITVISDVHGQLTELQELLEPLLDSGKHLLFIGDLIDRAEDADADYNTVKLVKHMNEHPDQYGLSQVDVIRGNHENFFVDLKNNPNADDFEIWNYNGGERNFYDNADEFMPWLEALPFYKIYGDYLFVHAGVEPGIPLEDQDPHQLVWIREEFLQCKDHGLPYTVVHGHSITPSREVEVFDKRIAIDTGSFLPDGKITALELEYTPVAPKELVVA